MHLFSLQPLSRERTFLSPRKFPSTIHSPSFPANKSRVTSITRDRFACCRTSHRWDNQTCSLLHLSLSMFLRFVHARFVHHWFTPSDLPYVPWLWICPYLFIRLPVVLIMNKAHRKLLLWTLALTSLRWTFRGGISRS